MIVVAVGVASLPFFMALLSSMTSFVNMIVTFPAYLFFLPTFVGWFAAYAFARTSDLTWGNRPSDSLETHDDGDEHQQTQVTDNNNNNQDTHTATSAKKKVTDASGTVLGENSMVVVDG